MKLSINDIDRPYAVLKDGSKALVLSINFEYETVVLEQDNSDDGDNAFQSEVSFEDIDYFIL